MDCIPHNVHFFISISKLQSRNSLFSNFQGRAKKNRTFSFVCVFNNSTDLSCKLLAFEFVHPNWIWIMWCFLLEGILLLCLGLYPWLNPKFAQNIPLLLLIHQLGRRYGLHCNPLALKIRQQYFSYSTTLFNATIRGTKCVSTKSRSPNTNWSSYSFQLTRMWTPNSPINLSPCWVKYLESYCKEPLRA